MVQRRSLVVHIGWRTNGLTDHVRPVYKSGMHLSDYMAGHNHERRVLSDEEVAAGINRSRATVSRIRRRVQQPDWATVRAIEAYSKGWVTANDFVDAPDRKPSQGRVTA